MTGRSALRQYGTKGRDHDDCFCYFTFVSVLFYFNVLRYNKSLYIELYVSFRYVQGFTCLVSEASF